MPVKEYKDEYSTIDWENDKEGAKQMAHAAWKGYLSFIYPRLARQIVVDYNITKGQCLDVGAGPARLSVELARITNLNMITLDPNPYSINIASKKVAEYGLESRFKLLKGSVQNMPFQESSFDLVVSRGAMGAFPDKPGALKEIYRVLKPGGIAYLGFGDARGWPRNPVDMVKKIRFKLKRRFKMFDKNPWHRKTPAHFWEEHLASAGIENYRIYRKGSLWIEITKTTAQ